MYITVDCRDNDCALGNPFDFLEIVFQVSNGLLHDLGGLQHERQNQLACAEFVADFLHGREQDVVEGVNCLDVIFCSLRIIFHFLTSGQRIGNKRIDIGFDAIFMAM